MHTSQYTTYTKIPDANEYLLVHGYTGAIDLVDERVTRFLREKREINENDSSTYPSFVNKDTLATLRERGYMTNLSPLEEREIVRKMVEVIHESASKKHSFLFLVAYDCNFRCPYCFENNISDYGKGWSGKVFSKNLVDRAYQCMLEMEPDRSRHHNRITLYGGEPLLADNYDIVSYIVQQGMDRGYTFTAITNGYDLNNFVDLLGEGLIESVQITIDGMPELHDKRRRHYLSQSTFSRIEENIDLVLSKGVDVRIRINTDLSNMNELTLLSEFFAEKKWSANPNFHSSSALICDNNDSIRCNSTMSSKAQATGGNGCNSCGCDSEQKTNLGEDAFINEVIENQYIIFDSEEGEFLKRNNDENIDFSMNDPDVLNLLARTKYMSEYHKLADNSEQVKTIDWQNYGLKEMVLRALKDDIPLYFRASYCGAHNGMFIFDPYGELYTCWEVVGVDKFKVGSYANGLKFNDEELNKWLGRTSSSIPQCSACKYALFCGGGCTVKNLHEGKGFHSSFCDALPKIFHTSVLDAYTQYSNDALSVNIKESA